MRVLVTGGAGFLGMNLCRRLLAQGHEVVCLDNFYTGARHRATALAGESPRFSIVQGDVSHAPVWMAMKGKFDQIYHLACPASPQHYQRDPHFTLTTAFGGTNCALSASGIWGAPLVVASTSEVYGDPDVSPQPESYWGRVNPVGPRSCYDEGKRAAEALCWAASQSGTDVRVARIFNTYGPGMTRDDGRMVPNFVTQALAGQPLTVHGDGGQTRSLCYVDDTVAGLQALMAAPRRAALPVYNIGNPDERTVLSIALDVALLSGASVPVLHGPAQPDDPRERRPDVSAAARDLGWAPAVDFKSGILETINWFRKERLNGV